VGPAGSESVRFRRGWQLADLSGPLRIPANCNWNCNWQEAADRFGDVHSQVDGALRLVMLESSSGLSRRERRRTHLAGRPAIGLAALGSTRCLFPTRGQLLPRLSRRSAPCVARQPPRQSLRPDWLNQ
jgi:hypothetical protein